MKALNPYQNLTGLVGEGLSFECARNDGKSTNFRTSLALLILGAALSLSTTSAHANSSLRKQVREAQQSCPELNCSDTLQLKDWSESVEVPESLVQRAIQRAKSAAQNHWPDTILEGPYQTDFRIQARSLEVLQQDDQVLGFRVLVSANAWEIESCDFDSRVPSTLNTCPAGEIVEAIFVSADNREAFVDENNYAQFIPHAIQ